MANPGAQQQGRYLSVQQYSSFLMSKIRSSGADFDGGFVKGEINYWFLSYQEHRRRERALELLISLAGTTHLLLIDNRGDLEWFADFARRNEVQKIPGFTGVLVASPLTGEGIDPGAYPFALYCGAPEQASQVTLLALGNATAEHGFPVIANDYLEAFVDLERFDGLAGLKERHPDRTVVLYADYRNVPSMSSLAGEISARDERYLSVGLLCGASESRSYDETVIEPFYYLWPLALYLAKPDLVHLNVGMGTMGLTLGPFLQRKDRALIDFYDVLSAVSDDFLNANCPDASIAVRSADRFLLKNFDFFMHRCSRETTDFLVGNFGKEQVLQVLEYVKEPLYFVPRDGEPATIRLAYGGLILANDAEPEDSLYKRSFREMAHYYCQPGLEFFIYPSPYLYGFRKNAAIDAMIQRYGITGIHNLDPLNEEEFVAAISRYDYGVLPPNLPGVRPVETGFILPNKCIAYLRAGLPVLTPSDLTIVADLVRRHGIGVIYEYEDRDRLPEILAGQDLRQLKENVRAFRGSLSITRGAQKVLALYQNMLSEGER